MTETEQRLNSLNDAEKQIAFKVSELYDLISKQTHVHLTINIKTPEPLSCGFFCNEKSKKRDIFVCVSVLKEK